MQIASCLRSATNPRWKPGTTWYPSIPFNLVAPVMFPWLSGRHTTFAPGIMLRLLVLATNRVPTVAKVPWDLHIFYASSSSPRCPPSFLACSPMRWWEQELDEPHVSTICMSFYGPMPPTKSADIPGFYAVFQVYFGVLHFITKKEP